ncbi:MAG: hypothetical protein JSV10_10375 [Candidatus Zixiibacteriota bacterium]|nr:MAG: hypothetical protein JSV10_10375 [candidate division Zixibacteria bacterium]
MNEEGKDLEGVRLYRPGVIAAYTVLSGMAIGLLLYALNLLRRGQRWLGVLTLVLCGVLFILIAAVFTMGGRMFGLGLLGVLAAILIYQLERKPFDLALERGATPAKWWPPILFVLAFLLVLIVAAGLFGPSDLADLP